MIELAYAQVTYYRDVPRTLTLRFVAPKRVEVSHRVPLLVDAVALTMRPAVESDAGETWDVEFVEEFGPRRDVLFQYTVRCVLTGASRVIGASGARLHTVVA